jgi:23S rRNA (uracil1939-C5)-methyltransferase
VRQLADIKSDEVIYDLYTGTGTIALFLARHAKKVVGLEYVEMAVDDAKANAVFNKIDNASFIAGDIKDLLTTKFIEEYGRPAIIITDPPRSGMHPDVVKALLAIRPTRIVYVSCNPATQARDLSLMNDCYTIKVVQPVDMFPHTHHVENVVLMELKN